jgi:transposase
MKTCCHSASSCSRENAPRHSGTTQAAQTFIRWSRLGVWERLHQLAQKRQPPELGLVFLDGTIVRAHQKAAGAKGGT